MTRKFIYAHIISTEEFYDSSCDHKKSLKKKEQNVESSVLRFSDIFKTEFRANSFTKWKICEILLYGLDKLDSAH